jgi:prepilin-type N-terminal cleavage/methylation domain-containing protein
MKRGQAGFSLMELIVVMGIVGSMLAIAAPAANRKAVSLPQAAEELQSNFRLARANSMRHGAHFRVTITGAKTYTIQRMQDGDGDRIWAVDSSYLTQTVTLPPPVSIGSATLNKRIEFNQRGLLHSTITGEIPAVVYVPPTLTDGSTKTIEVWPSGQVQES